MNRNESVIKVFGIIEYLAQCESWIGLRRLAKDLDIDPSTAHRFLSSLKDLGYIQQRPGDNAYKLTLRFAWLSSQIIDRIQLRSIILPRMEHLTEVTNETCHLSVLDGDEFVYIEKVDGTQAIRMRSRIGNRGYLHCTASGKVLLANLPDAEKEDLLSHLELKPMTKNTTTDKNSLRNALVLTCQQGYGIDDEENEIGIRCVAVPIKDQTDKVVAALSLSGWTISMTTKRLVHLVDDLREASEAISHEIGYISINLE